jgi:hypothetical protein
VTGRIVGAVIGLAGAVAVLVASFIPIYRFGGDFGFTYRIIDRHPQPQSILAFALEPLGAIVLVLAAVVFMLALGGRREPAALVTAAGIWMLCLFAGYIAWIALDGDGSSDVRPGAVVGLLGGAAMLAGGIVSWVSTPTTDTETAFEPARPEAPSPPERAPAGWYPDPAGSAGSRYWDGVQWTDAVRADT